MRLATRLTERFGIDHPILSAPMGLLAGGRLAAAVTNAGGLGLIGGGYGDPDWLEQEFAAAGNTRVGCGFITWSLETKPELIDQVLSRKPAALMLSFGLPTAIAYKATVAGIPVICQVQSMATAKQAVAAGAEVVVAQGGEAGGHSGNRSTFTLVPEIADMLAREAPDTLLVAAGGIMDGRGLAAALMLGADGVMLGSRFVASHEASTPAGFQPAIVAADGDATIKTRVIDIVRGYEWSPEYEARALRNGFVQSWHGREAELSTPSTNSAERQIYWEAFQAGQSDRTGLLIGQGVGLVDEVTSAEVIIASIVSEACLIVAKTVDRLVIK